MSVVSHRRKALSHDLFKQISFSRHNFIQHVVDQLGFLIHFVRVLGFELSALGQEKAAFSCLRIKARIARTNRLKRIQFIIRIGGAGLRKPSSRAA